MDDPEIQARRARAAKRRETLTISRGTLDEPPPEPETSAEQRLAMMWQLACDAWVLSGRPFPSYSRADMPGRVIRPPP